MEQKTHFGQIITNRRRFLKLTQEQLASFAGVSLRSLKTIENDSGNPTLGQLTKVLSILGMQLTIEIK